MYSIWVIKKTLFTDLITQIYSNSAVDFCNRRIQRMGAHFEEQ